MDDAFMYGPWFQSNSGPLVTPVSMTQSSPASIDEFEWQGQDFPINRPLQDYLLFLTSLVGFPGNCPIVPY